MRFLVGMIMVLVMDITHYLNIVNIQKKMQRMKRYLRDLFILYLKYGIYHVLMTYLMLMKQTGKKTMRKKLSVNYMFLTINIS